jgi:hypothetical protein
MGIFDFFKDIFDGVFGGGDDEIYNWSNSDDAPMSWSSGDDFGDMSSIWVIEERLIDDYQGGELTGTSFADLQGALDYVEGTPENVLKIFISDDGEFYVYRFPSD